MPRRLPRVDILAALLPVALAWILYEPLIGAGYFTGDDTLALRRTLEYGPLALFLDPVAWRQYSPAFVMPWNAVSLRLDLALFGLEPSGYFAHQLVSLSVAIVLLVAWLRRYLTPAAACIAACAFVVNRPAASVATAIMTRHYVEGLAFALAAMLLVDRMRVERQRHLGLLEAGCASLYLLAMACKEIFVPLPLVALALVAHEPRARRRLAVALGLALAIYVAWRAWLLGINNVLISYGSLDAGPIAGGVGRWLIGVPGAIGWGWISAALLALLALPLTWQQQRPQMPWLAIAAIAAAALPLVGVFPQSAPRFFLIPVLVACAGIGFAIDSVPWPRRGAAIVMLAFLATWTIACWGPPRAEVHAAVSRSRDVEDVARFLLSPSATGLGVRVHQESGGYFAHLLWLRRSALGDASATPRACGDPCVCGESALRWVEVEQGAIVPIDFAAAECPRLHGVDLDLDYDPRRLRLRWRASPAPGSALFFSRSIGDAPNIGLFAPLPRSGEVPMQLLQPTDIVFKVRDATGHVAYTDPIVVSPIGTQ